METDACESYGVMVSDASDAWHASCFSMREVLSQCLLILDGLRGLRGSHTQGTYDVVSPERIWQICRLDMCKLSIRLLAPRR